MNSLILHGATISVIHKHSENRGHTASVQLASARLVRCRQA